MKKIILILVAATACAVMTAQTYDTMYYPNGRVPYYYYSEWYDTTDEYTQSLTHPKVAACYGGWEVSSVAQSLVVGLRFNMPLLIKGIAVMESTDPDYRLTLSANSPLIQVPDSAPTAPEYVYLFRYDTATRTEQILATARWDTAAPKIWKIPVSNNPQRTDSINYCKVYEVTFPRPVGIDPDHGNIFYIFGTCNSVTYRTDHDTLASPHGGYRIRNRYTFLYQPHEYAYIVGSFNYGNMLFVETLVSDSTGSPFSEGMYMDNPFTSVFRDRIPGYWGSSSFMPIVDTAEVEEDYVLLEASSADTAMGTASPARDTVLRWFFREVSATPRPGYRFDHWNDGSQENPHRVQLTTDSVHYIATFRRDVYHVSAEPEDKDRGLVTGDGQYLGLDTAVLVASAYEGYRFSHWNDSVTDNPRHVVVLSDTQFVAYFEVDTSGGDDTVAAHAPVAEAAVTVTPNPTTGWVTVTAENSPVVQVEAYDAQGRRVAEATGNRGTVSIDLGGQPAGEYILHIALTDGRTVRRVVKTR